MKYCRSNRIAMDISIVKNNVEINYLHAKYKLQYSFNCNQQYILLEVEHCYFIINLSISFLMHNS